jgi:DNA-binding NtrC family response regulator
MARNQTTGQDVYKNEANIGHRRHIYMMERELLCMKNNHTFQAEGPVKRPLPDQTRSPRRILVAHDNCDIRELSMELLIRSGYQVDAAGDSASAWEALNAVRYDLLVTDYEMPRVSGMALLRKLRTIHNALPVIMASGTRRDFAGYSWVQPVATLAMPYTVEEFLDTVEEILHANAERTDPVGAKP